MQTTSSAIVWYRPCSGLAGVVEEEDVAEAEDEARDGHRQHRQQAHQRPERIGAARLLEHVGADEDQDRAEERRSSRELQAVEESVADLGIDEAHRVVLPARCQVVRPVGRERREHGHAEHRQHERADDRDVAEHQRVEAARGLAASAAPRALSASPSACAGPANRCRRSAPPASAAEGRRPRRAGSPAGR